ncbi:DUF47 domain-containing protein [Falsibacillus pallidus]|uniref:DUF47 domain-containing protein n=1 Tax=Falsibacillus pallidus TaxID=493781 RepID=A0A370GZ76_9BACI|nr:DUF47 domain-containing protein [Falsibacillus pallidus]RDI47954.1 hypothetical protein DFR59_101621 [Falsibacillus pallidus]
MALIGKKDKFSILLGNISSNIVTAANYYADFKITNVSDLKIFSDKMKEYETKGDTLVHDMILELNQAFITPIEREDLLALTMTLDDVLDGLEHNAALFEMYSITSADDYMIKFVEAIRNCAIEIEKAINLLSTRKLKDIREHAIRIKDQESMCDGVLRQSIKNLFATEKDPIQIIKVKEIYENLEEIADDCQNVANTLETIVMKNA